MKTIDITGQRFGRLMVLEESGRGKNRKVLWKCICDCGKVRICDGVNLRRGNTKSCGCFNNERKSEVHITHGFLKTPQKRRFYRIFKKINERCTYRNDISYKYYGARNIKNLWKSFEEFRDDMWNSYQSHVKEFGEKNTSIDRINNNEDYWKGNCRWATWSQQNYNKRFISK